MSTDERTESIKVHKQLLLTFHEFSRTVPLDTEANRERYARQVGNILSNFITAVLSVIVEDETAAQEWLEELMDDLPCRLTEYYDHKAERRRQREAVQ